MQGRVEWLLTHLEKALREQGWPIQEPFSWVNAVAVESRRNQMGQ